MRQAPVQPEQDSRTRLTMDGNARPRPMPPPKVRQPVTLPRGSKQLCLLSEGHYAKKVFALHSVRNTQVPTRLHINKVCISPSCRTVAIFSYHEKRFEIFRLSESNTFILQCRGALSDGWYPNLVDEYMAIQDEYMAIQSTCLKKIAIYDTTDGSIFETIEVGDGAKVCLNSNGSVMAVAIGYLVSFYRMSLRGPYENAKLCTSLALFDNRGNLCAREIESMVFSPDDKFLAILSYAKQMPPAAPLNYVSTYSLHVQSNNWNPALVMDKPVRNEVYLSGLW